MKADNGLLSYHPDQWNITEILLPFLFFVFCLSLALNGINWYYGRKAIPAALDRMAERIAKGKVPTAVNLILKERVSGYVEHYKLVPGRMSCRIGHYRCGEPGIYTLIIGFKEHARKPADKYITIPVYKNGKLYEH